MATEVTPNSERLTNLSSSFWVLILGLNVFEEGMLTIKIA